MRLRYFLLLLSVVVLAGLTGPESFAKEPAKIRFGALPVLQALPIYVAQDKGLFAKAGVNVDVIPFNTASGKRHRSVHQKYRRLFRRFGHAHSAERKRT